MGKTFEQIKQSLGDWLGITDPNDDRLPSSVRGDIINIVMREFMRNNETRYGEFTDTFQTQKEIRDYDLPVGWSKPRSVWYLTPEADEIVFLEYVDKDTFDEKFPASGLYGVPAPVGAGTLGQSTLGDPTIYTVWADKMQLGLVPNRAAPGITIYRNYWRYFPDLADGAPNNTNQFTDEAWEYLLFAGLVKATEFGIEDERIPTWEKEAKRIGDAIVLEYIRSQMTAKRSQTQEPG